MLKAGTAGRSRFRVQAFVLATALFLLAFLGVAVASGKPGEPSARQVWPLAIAFLAALLVSYAGTPLVERIARRYGFQDRPSKHHVPPMKPRLGGVAMYVAFVVAVLATMPLVPDRTAEETRRIWGILAGSSLLLAMGAIDDRRELAPLPQFATQIGAALIAMSLGVIIYQVPNPFGNPFSKSTIDFALYLAIPFTLFWIVGAVNTVDFIDGLDGLAAGVGAIAAIVLFLHSFHLTQYSVALLPLVLAGATLGFLPYNFFPARITMGTSGAAFLGFGLATLSVIGGTKAATVLLVLGIPIVDTAWIIVNRIRQRRSPFRGDRAHLHHRLMARGLSQAQIVLLMYVLCAAFGILALVVSARLFKLYVFIGIVLLVGGIVAAAAQKRLSADGAAQPADPVVAGNKRGMEEGE